MLGAFAWAFAGMAFGATPGVRIQFAEKVSIRPAAGPAEFDAYGRRFSFELQPNDRLVRSLNAAGKQAVDASRLLRGRLNGAPGSWVRLAKVGNALEGAIWDGHDLYVVTSKSAIESKLTLPIDGAPSQTLVYRLSDTIGGLPDDFCGLVKNVPASPVKAQTGLQQYTSIVSALRANAADLAASEQLDIALIADTEFQASFGATAHDEMLARLNTVDGIFADQVGVLIVPTEVRLIPAGSDPFTKTDAEALLQQLADYRSANPAVKAPGLAHLMTGKNLDGNTIGIAYLDTLCDPHEGVSISDSEMGSFNSALVMAHELGHNFGAPHDGASGACSATPQNYLMAPALNGSTQFSQCSLTQMQAAIARARNVCIVPAHYADVALTFPQTQPTFNVGEEFGYPITVTSAGDDTAKNVTLTVSLPPQLIYQSAVLASGSCSAGGAGGQLVTCALGDIPGGETRTVELRLKSDVLGSDFVMGNLSADNDIIQFNNSASGYLGLQSALDLGVTLTSSVTQLYATDPIDFTIDVNSTRSQTAHGAQLTIFLGSAPIESFAAGAHDCAIAADNPSTLICHLADVAGHDTTRITVHARPTFSGLFYASANLSLPNDGDYSNNNAQTQFTVRAEREVATTASSENMRIVLGTDNDLVYTLTSIGRLPATNVQLVVSAGSEIIQSIVPSAGTCTRPGPYYAYTCDFGTLDPGAVRTVTVRVRMDTAGQSSVAGNTQYTNGTMQGYSNVYTWVYANLRIDVTPHLYSYGQTVEGQAGSGDFEIDSIGVDPGQNVVATLDLPAPIRLTGFYFGYNPDGFVCAVANPQRLRCTGSFGTTTNGAPVARVSFSYVSDTATTAQATLTTSADGDGNPANDTVQTTLIVSPAIEVDLTSTTTSLMMVIGHDAPMNLTLTTGHNPVQNATVSGYGSSPYYDIDSIVFNGTTCPRDPISPGPFGNYVCHIGDLPANGSWPVTIHYHPLQPGVTGGNFVNAGALNISRGGGYSFNFSTLAEADLAVGVAQKSATATNGTTLHYPLITLTSTGYMAQGIAVDIPLPAFASVSNVSTSALATCTGTSTLHCELYGLLAGDSATIDITLNTTATGTFTSSITATAGNDFNAANNTADVSLSVTAPTSGGGSSSSGGGSSSGGVNTGGGSGKGGGGSMEWLGLAFLGLLVMRRMQLGRAPIWICAGRHREALLVAGVLSIGICQAQQAPGFGVSSKVRQVGKITDERNAAFIWSRKDAVGYRTG